MVLNISAGVRIIISGRVKCAQHTGLVITSAITPVGASTQFQMMDSSANQSVKYHVRMTNEAYNRENLKDTNIWHSFKENVPLM